MSHVLTSRVKKSVRVPIRQGMDPVPCLQIPAILNSLPILPPSPGSAPSGCIRIVAAVMEETLARTGDSDVIKELWRTALRSSCQTPKLSTPLRVMPLRDTLVFLGGTR